MASTPTESGRGASCTTEGRLSIAAQPLLAVDVVDVEPKSTETSPAGQMEISIGLPRLCVSRTAYPPMLKTAIAELRA